MELTHANDQLTQGVSELEQYSRINNIEIRGVRLTKGESCAAILQEIAEKIDCHVATTHIDVVRRVPAKVGHNIIARFCSRDKKADFAAQAKKEKFTTTSIRFTVQNDADTPVFINYHLTLENKRLFAQALSLKKEKQWQFLWVDNCCIKAPKTTDSHVYWISRVSDLAIFK